MEKFDFASCGDVLRDMIDTAKLQADIIEYLNGKDYTHNERLLFKHLITEQFNFIVTIAHLKTQK